MSRNDSLSKLLWAIVNRVVKSIRFRVAAKLRKVQHSVPVVEQLDLSLLPANFDPAFYLKMNPDLGVVDPVKHYLKYGRHEVWRVSSLPEVISNLIRPVDPALDTILVVSHEASRSGAPILAFDLVKRLSVRYNVVVLLLGEGALLKSFQEAANALMNGSKLKGNSEYSKQAIQFLAEEFNFKFALVNSLESGAVLEPLSRNFVPSICLIHEFISAYSDAKALLTDVMLWADKLVFSTSLTLANAEELLPELSNVIPLVMPQGRCVLPEHDNGEGLRLAESKALKELIRPDSDTDRKFVVLGAGYVNYRKGVDLFIQCAIKAMSAPGGGRFRFVWIGKGYNPEAGDVYSVYLADQIKRSGLSEKFLMLGETSAINTAYAEADALFLSSRLDPLPNVAIDAMEMRLPVVCFNKASGIAEFLSACGMHESCVAEYLDVESAFGKISELANSPALYEQTITQSYQAFVACFDADKYVGKLEQLGLRGFDVVQQVKRDVKTITDSGVFVSRGDSANVKDVLQYVRGNARGMYSQHPFEKFCPLVYLAEHGVSIKGSDPLADYIRAGRPEGAWNRSA